MGRVRGRRWPRREEVRDRRSGRVEGRACRPHVIFVCGVRREHFLTSDLMTGECPRRVVVIIMLLCLCDVSAVSGRNGEGLVGSRPLKHLINPLQKFFAFILNFIYFVDFNDFTVEIRLHKN